MFNLRFATSSDQLEDKTAFEKEARSVISLMQLPLTGVFNRLTLSVCRATIDTQVTFSRGFFAFQWRVSPSLQSLSRVSAFEWNSSALQQRLAAPSKSLPPVVLVCSRVLQVRYYVTPLSPRISSARSTAHALLQNVTPRPRRFHGS